MEDNDLKSAKAVYKTLCEMLDEHGWSYEKNEDNLTVMCGMQGDDFLIPLRVDVNAESQFVIVLSELLFIVPEGRRNAMVMAVSKANTSTMYGCFDYDFFSGRIVFRKTSCFHESLISKEMLEHLVISTCQIVDVFNDKLLTVANSEMTIDEVNKYMREVCVKNE